MEIKTRIPESEFGRFRHRVLHSTDATQHVLLSGHMLEWAWVLLLQESADTNRHVHPRLHFGCETIDIFRATADDISEILFYQGWPADPERQPCVDCGSYECCGAQATELKVPTSTLQVRTALRTVVDICRTYLGLPALEWKQEHHCPVLVKEYKMVEETA